MRIGQRTLQRIRQAVLGYERQTFSPLGESRRRGGGGRPAEVRQVKLEWSSGSDGDATTAPTHRYHLYPRDVVEMTEGTRLASDVPVESRPLATGRCIKAPDGSLGEAYIGDGDWRLIWPYGERYGTKLCDPDSG